MPRSGSSRSTSLREPDIRFSDSEKFDGAGSWEAVEWTKVEPVTCSVPEVVRHFLLKEELVTMERHGVVLVNTDEAGTLFITNFRLLFLSEGLMSIIRLGTIPLATIEKFSKIAKLPGADKTPSRRLLQITGKDMRIIVFGFRPRTKQRHAIYEQLLRLTQPLRIWDLYAFTTPSGASYTGPKVRLVNEYFRLLGRRPYRVTTSMIEDGSFTLSNKFWRISSVNSDYTVCPTYPFALLVPKLVGDEEVRQVSAFRSRFRLPVISWCNPGTGAVLARSSQPLVGLMMNMRSNADEKLVAALRTELPFAMIRKLYIVDARARKNAIANGAMGGGSESSSYYSDAEIVFFGIDNIHAMRDSFFRLRDYLDTHGATSSDGMSSFLRHGGSSWGGGNLSSMSTSVSTFGDSGWLMYVQSILAGSAWIAARIALESASVLVHCSDGWDRTTQLVSLASLLLDPYYRTIEGFQALVEKDWLAFGHPFADRLGTPSVSGGGGMPLELSQQNSAGSIPSSSSFTFQASASSQAQHSYSPIFLQWVDCVSQLLRIYPLAFEFSSAFLVDLVDSVLSCRFGNFLGNSELERQEAGTFSACSCLWAYMADLRVSAGVSHVHYNPFYESSQHDGALLPPAAALAPTLWPQFHLRWACPLESRAGELDAQCRNLSKKLTELQKAKEEAEDKFIETTASLESVAIKLRTEKEISSSAKDLAKRASKENAAIKRAVQSLGIEVHFSENGDCSVGLESNPTESPKKSAYSSPKEGSGVTADDALPLNALGDDASDHPLNRVCENLCPLRTRDGGCRWPNAGCARLGSQFVGLKANFDAFDRLSIYDSYFQP